MRALAAIISLVTATCLSSAAIAGPGESVPIPYSFEDAQRGAHLRAEAAIVIPIVFNPCGSSAATDPTGERYRQFVADLDDLRHRLDLEIVRADFDYRMSLVDLACPELDAPETLEAEKLDISVANSVLDRMDRLVKPASGQDN